MTAREIAFALGKNDRTVRRWITRLADTMPVIADKLSSSSPMDPADYSLDETIEIIHKGLGKNAADIYRMNAETKPPEQTGIDYKKLAEVIAVAVSAVLSAPKEPLQIEGPTHMALMGYCNKHEIDYDSTSWLRSTAMVVRGICQARGLDVRKVPDERYGTVNSYPISILDEYFSI